MHAGDVADAVRAADEPEAEYRRQRHRRALGDPAARPRRAGHRRRAAPHVAAPRRPAARTAVDGPRRKRRRLRIPPGVVVIAVVLLAMVLGGFWLATRAVYFVGTDPHARRHGHDLPRPARRPPARHRALQPLPGSGVTLESVPAGAAQDVHGPQAALEGRRGEPRDPARTRTARARERAQPRADGADPGVAAADRRLRRDLHPAVRAALGRLADLRRDLPAAVPRRALRDPLHAALRGPVPVPARQRARVLRAGRDLPDRRGRWRASRRSGSWSG